MSLQNGTPASNTRTVLVTGGTSGLGRKCAKALVETGPEWHVMITSRSDERAKTAASALRAATGTDRGEVLIPVLNRMAGWPTGYLDDRIESTPLVEASSDEPVSDPPVQRHLLSTGLQFQRRLTRIKEKIFSVVQKQSRPTRVYARKENRNGFFS
jgi:hypothetical protein